MMNSQAVKVRWKVKILQGDKTAGEATTGETVEGVASGDAEMTGETGGSC